MKVNEQVTSVIGLTGAVFFLIMLVLLVSVALLALLKNVFFQATKNYK